MLDQLALKPLRVNVHQRKMKQDKQQEIRNCCASIFRETCQQQDGGDVERIIVVWCSHTLSSPSCCYCLHTPLGKFERQSLYIISMFL